MSSTVSTYTTNWVTVQYSDGLEEHIQYINEKAECFESGERFTIHHYKQQIRVTAFDVIDQEFGYYEDEEEEIWIDLEEEITSVLADGEVLRLTSLSWFKGRLESMNVSVSTWDGRKESRSTHEWFKEMAQVLEVDQKKLGGWN